MIFGLLVVVDKEKCDYCNENVCCVKVGSFLSEEEVPVKVKEEVECKVI